MTNFEVIKNFDIENMALTIMCPYEAGLMDDYICNQNEHGVYDGHCAKCVLQWLQEESK